MVAWHESSLKISLKYMKSLETIINEKGCVEDYLFRLAINCENHAISPSWWESRNEIDKNKITEYISDGVNVFAKTSPNYLMSGLEGISDWQLNEVISSY